MSREMNFCYSQEIYPTNMGKKILDTATKTGLDTAKTTSKKVVYKTAEATGELIGNNIAKNIVKQKTYPWCEFRKC